MSPTAGPKTPERSADVACASGGWIRAARRPPGWSPPGPQPAGHSDRDELWPRPGEDLCYLTGDFRIFQRTDGHRWSLDDLLTGWRALSWEPRRHPHRVLDLGCGIGSVLMMLAWKLEDASVTGVEAQKLSVGLARRSLAYNGLESRVRVHHGDIRDPSLNLTDHPFDLITGTPPYFQTSDGVVSTMPQKGPCRFEVRGGVEAYAQATARHLAPDGMFTVCEDARQATRVEAALRAHRLAAVDRLDAIGREGKEPLFSVFRCARGEAPDNYAVETMTVRDRHGQWTPAFAAVREMMGLPPKLTAGGAGRTP